VVALLLLAAAGCKPESPPRVSSDPAKQSWFDWNFRTLTGAYEKAPFGSRKWDAPAKAALTEFARLRSEVTETNEASNWIIGTNCDNAIRAGCKDPMIAYLHARFFLDQTNSPKVFTEALCSAAQTLEQSSYPKVRKFYAWLRAGQQITFTYGYGTNVPASLQQLCAYGHSITNLLDSLADTNMPAGEVYDACHDLLVDYESAKDPYQSLYNTLEQRLNRERLHSAPLLLLKGQAHVCMAWNERGGGYANTVSEQGWRGFENHLDIAEQALEKAWLLNSNDARIPLEMLTVELGQGKGRDQMELWFQRAMAIDPNDYDACHSKLYYLEPKWHGSDADLIDFGWQCVESKRWGGHVPLILLDAHEALARYVDKTNRADYWKQPQVWPDIQAAFERFFQLNPGETGWLHNYAWNAYRCGQWAKFNELVTRLGPINYSYFGGRAEFDRMALLAQAHAQDTNAGPDPLSLAVQRLTARIGARVSAGKKSEADFADLLPQCDDLIAAAKADKPEVAAGLILVKMQLQLEVFHNAAAARELVAQLKKDCGGTQLGGHADDLLAYIDKKEAISKIQGALAVGKPFPEFAEKDLMGSPLAISGLRGKIVLVDFWATWCGPCVAELPNVLAAYRRYHDQGFEVVGLSLDEDRERLAAFIQQKKIPWPQYFDGGGWTNKLAKQYGVESIPATFLLDREGIIIAKDARGEDLDKAVKAALAKK
jgi:peroxiredoxin